MIDFCFKVEYKAKITKNGVKYTNLFDFLSQKAKDGAFGDGGVTEREYREALNVLEDDGVI